MGRNKQKPNSRGKSYQHPTRKERARHGRKSKKSRSTSSGVPVLREAIQEHKKTQKRHKKRRRVLGAGPPYAASYAHCIETRGAAIRHGLVTPNAYEAMILWALRALLKNNGFTYRPGMNGKALPPVSEGFAVAITGGTVLHGDLKGREIKFGLRTFIKWWWGWLWESSGHYIGGWYDRKNKRIYLDPTVVVQDLQSALALAAEHNQQAIFSLKDREVIPVNAAQAA